MAVDRCVSGKRIYASLELAEDVLLETWTRFEFAPGNGPVAIYRCDDCGQYHLTSKGPMNEKLSQALREGKIHRQREANHWAEKFKGKR